MLRRVALVRTDISEELSASFIRMTKIGELGTTLANVPPKRLFLQERNGVTSQKSAFFIVLALPYHTERPLPFFKVQYRILLHVRVAR
jgi:hypothetical protein